MSDLLTAVGIVFFGVTAALFTEAILFALMTSSWS